MTPELIQDDSGHIVWASGEHDTITGKRHKGGVVDLTVLDEMGSTSLSRQVEKAASALNITPREVRAKLAGGEKISY